MKTTLTFFISSIIFLLFSCREVRRDISSVNNLIPGITNSFSAEITTLRNNGKRVTISGGCEIGAQVIFYSEFLENDQEDTVDCEDGVYDKKLYFKNDIEGRMWIQARQNDQSIDVLVPFVDTRNPGRLIVTSPVDGYRYGNSIFFSGRCETGAKVYIRSFYLEGVLRTVLCAHGIFVSSVYLKDSIANESQLLFSLYQVDPYGNSSKPIKLQVTYQLIENSISLDEQMIPFNGTDTVITGYCGDFDIISVSGKQIECKNKKFSFKYDEKKHAYNEDLLILVVEGIKLDGTRSAAKIAILYNQYFETNPRFFSPSGVYDGRLSENFIVSGTCGKTYFQGSVRLYTDNRSNILRNGETIPLKQDGSFKIDSSNLVLNNTTRIYAECIDYYIKYKTNNFHTDFRFVEPSSINRISKEIDIKRPIFMINGSCTQKGVVVIVNTRNGKRHKSDCVDGNVKFNIEADQLWGSDVFEVYEENIFEEIKSEKQLFKINYNIFPIYPSQLNIEAPSPLWGSLRNDVILYWSYPLGVSDLETSYGIFSRDSYIQARWERLPKGTRNVIIRGRDLIKLGYEECSEVQLFLRIRKENSERSIVVESKGFYFDFTPPSPIEVLSTDYGPLFRGKLPEFKISKVEDNCSDYNKHDWIKGIQWYELRLYKIDLIKSNIDLVEERFLFNLADINESQKKYDLEGIFQIGIVAVDMGLNRSKEYRSIMFSWN